MLEGSIFKANVWIMDVLRASRPQIFLFLFFASVLIYSGSLNGDFLQDDHILIVNNSDIKHLKTIPLLFTSPLFKFSFHAFESGYNYYRPMMSLSFAVDYHLWGMKSFGYHLTNVIIHAVNAFLVLCLVHRLFANYPLAVLSSILFCVHPMQTDAVSYISNRSELLVSLFVLLSLTSYMEYIIFQKGWMCFVSTFSFILALLSREAGFVMFVPIFILIRGWQSGLSKKYTRLHFISFSGILAIYLILRLTVLVPVRFSPQSPFPLALDIINFSRILIGYLKLFIYPNALHILKTIDPALPFLSVEVILPVIFMFLLIAVLAISVKQGKHILFFGVSWFILTLLYLIRFMYKFPGRIAMEEHWAYLASVGLFLALAYLILRFKRQKLVITASTFIISGYAFLAFIHNWHWRNEIDFYRYSLKLVDASLSYIPRTNLISALSRQGLYNEALSQIDIMLAIEPKSWMAHIQRGDILKQMQKFPEAEEAYKSALKIDSFCWQANRRLKLLAEERGEAYKYTLDPRLSPIEAKIVSLIGMGNFNEALLALEEALSASPTPQLHTLSGITFGKMGLYDESIKAFHAALKIDPGFLPALHNLAIAYENKHLPREADVTRKMLERKK